MSPTLTLSMLPAEEGQAGTVKEPHLAGSPECPRSWARPVLGSQMSQRGRGTRDQRKEHVNRLQISYLRGVNTENQNTMSTRSKGVPRTGGWRQSEEAARAARMGEKKGRGGG